MRKLSTFFLILTLFAGVGFFVYPDVASWWNGRIQAGILDEYTVEVSQMFQEQIDARLQQAQEFNARITEINMMDPFSDTDALPEEYLQTLNIRGVMARIEIPVINVDMPVLHGTSYDTLNRAAGHLAGTHLPIGGESTHAVITAHSGLSSARMFTDMLDGNVYIGDYFFITVLDQRLAYRVVQIDTVLPHEVDLIRVYAGEDFVTLITCTPLTVNSHRLLVRGSRVPYTPYMAEEIVPVITVMHTNWRLIVAVGAFALFMLVFAGYQVGRIFRGWLRKRWGLPVEGPPVAAPVVVIAPGYEGDPYVAVPHTAGPMVAPAYFERNGGPSQQHRNSPKKSNSDAWRKIMAGIAILIMMVGAGIMLYPQVHRQIHRRYTENLINEWTDRLDFYRGFIRQRWVNERIALWSSVNGLTVTYNGGFYVGPSGNVYLDNLVIYSNGEPFTVGPDGSLNVGGNIVGYNGSVFVGNLSISTGGYFYVNGDGVNFFTGGNAGNLTIDDLTLGRDGFTLYLGGIPLENITIDCLEDFVAYHDLDFIFNFDINEDPMYWLYQQMVDYNFDLYETEQEGLVDLEAAEEVDFSVSETAGFREEMLGYITIEILNIRLPIFAGSSNANLLRGAAHMSHTSLPVGGISTNSVITAHNGMSRARMFDNLEDLVNGDIITITNFYQTLTYVVTGRRIVNPVLDMHTEMDYILIREGIDMITLLTCYPYRINSHRLLVFAERLPEEQQ